MFSLSEMLEYVEISKTEGSSVNWAEILSFAERPRISLIQVFDDSDKSIVLAEASLGWVGDVLKLQKIEVHNQKQGIGTTMLKMVIAIAKFHNASRIEGTVAGEKFLWEWYQKFGFEIQNDRELLMQFNQDNREK